MVNRLTDIISIKIYLEIYIIIFNFQQNHRFFYFCCDIPGCPDELKRRGYYLICQFHRTYSLEDLENIKHKPLKLISLYEKLKNDLFEITRYHQDEFVFELWSNQVTFIDKYTKNVSYFEDFIEILFFVLLYKIPSGKCLILMSMCLCPEKRNPCLLLLRNLFCPYLCTVRAFNI